MATQTRTIRVVVDTKQAQGLKQLSSQFGKMNRQVKNVDSNLNNLKRVFQGIAGAFGVREVARSADTFQLLRDRIKVFTGDAEKANEVFNDIRFLAKETRTSVENFAEGYNRVAIATQGLKLSSDQTLGVVTALQQSLRLSGASAQESASVFIQLSQALSLGRLQGQELRSVLLSNAVVANILADEFGVTAGQLKELGEQGKLTSDRVIKALANNFTDLNNKAQGLGTTFEQSLTIAFDGFRNKIDELNKRFDINSKFFKGVEFFIENLESIVKALSILVGSSLFLKLGTQIATFSTQMKVAVSSTAAFTTAISSLNIGVKLLSIAISFLVVEAATNWDKFVLNMEKGALRVEEAFLKVEKSIVTFVRSFGQGSDSSFLKRIFGDVGDLDSVNNGLEKVSARITEVDASISKLDKIAGENNPFSRITKDIQSFEGVGNIESVTGDFGRFNQALREGIITVDDYRKAIDSVELSKLNKDVKEGKISWDQYFDSLVKINSAFDHLDGAGQIVAGLQIGTNQFLRSIGSVAQEVSSATVNAFNSLEEELFQFTKTGKFEFNRFAQSILDDLTRILIRASLLRAIFGSSGTSSISAPGASSDARFNDLGGNVVASAKGNVYAGGSLQRFATGGIVNSPTYFPTTTGAGLMGEAGSEAIMPLTRGPGGRLGVDASGAGTTVNVINNSSGEVETRESTGPSGEKQIDVIILDRMNRAFRDGKMDKVMKNTFNISRKGR